MVDTSTLELAYEKCLHQHHDLQEIERFRRLRLKLIQLEDLNEDLQTHIAGNDDHNRRRQRSQDVIQARCKEAEGSLESAQGEIRIKGQEIETLKAEVSSLRSVTMDSTKLLTEKLALARELSTLRPEVDHLRSQAASNQSLLAEKLSLNHHLRTVQIQLETEKRSTQRMLAKDGKARAEDAQLKIQLQTVEAELSRERRERQKSERGAQEASSTWEAQKMTLESRLESLRNKLRTTKDSLKEAQQELQRTRSVTKEEVAQRAGSAHGRTTATKLRKRTATQMLSDSMIGTPGNETEDRKTIRMSTLPGDKSTFSITPYLNRTTSFAPESPPEAATMSLATAKTREPPSSPKDPGYPTPKVRQAAAAEELGSEKAKMLGTAKPSKANAKVAPSQQKRKIASTLEKVAEEENDENNENLDRLSKRTRPTSGDDTTVAGSEAKKKKRKLLGGGLGRRLFDDDDDRELGKPGPGATRLGALNRAGSLGPKYRSLLVVPSASSSTFGSFSPLKRSRQPTATRT
ncbi:MAG: hypothetical protein Q9166_004748 [cf. Caloplaca sp. 2 TL-2023]